LRYFDQMGPIYFSLQGVLLIYLLLSGCREGARIFDERAGREMFICNFYITCNRGKPCMSKIEQLSTKLKALSHPTALKIVTLLAKEGKDMYLNQIAKSLEINRALAKIHLKKLERGGIVKSRVVLVEGEALALRYYKLEDFDIHVSPEVLKKEGEEIEK
jgi:ArsR family transcriptional regulator